MRRRTILAASAGGGLLPATALAQQAAPPSPGAAPAALDTMLRPYLDSHGLPALAAAVVRDGQVAAAGAVGTRRAGATIPVTPEDRFHLGSCTKAFTALLAGILADEGRIGWEASIGALFPELRDGMDAGLAGVTLDRLLSHTGGIPTDTDAIIGELYVRSSIQEELNLDGMRRWILGQWRGNKLISAPGTQFHYANLGYVFAGAMLEKAAGSSWEELVAARIFAPLGLRSAGFGPPASLGRVDSPLGHETLPDGMLRPMLAGPNGDAPPALGPAGTAHMSILDFARWAGWHAGAGRRGPALVKPATLARLHGKAIEMPPRPDAAPGTPSQGGYGHGWGFATLPWMRGEAMLHTGSNSMNLAMVLVQPGRDYAQVIASNRGDPRADAALKGLQEALYREFAPAG